MMASQKTGHERFTAATKPGESVLSVILASHNAFQLISSGAGILHARCPSSILKQEAQEINGNHFPRAKAQLVE